jgi:hypothetical protein
MLAKNRPAANSAVESDVFRMALHATHRAPHCER